METPLEKSIQSQRPMSRRMSAPESEQQQTLQLLHSLLGQRNDNPSAINNNLLMSAIPNAMGQVQNPDIQRQLLEFYTSNQQQQGQPVQQPSSNRRRMGNAPIQQQSASDWNAQQHSQNLAYNNTAALQNTISRYQQGQNSFQEAAGAYEDKTRELTRQQFGSLLHPDAFKQETRMMMINGEPVTGSVQNINPNRPTLEQLGAHFRSLPPSEQARLYAAGHVPQEVLGGAEGSKMLEANAKAIEEQHYGRVKVLGDEMAKGNISAEYDDKGNRVFTQWITDPNASVSDIAMGKGRKKLPLSPIQMHDLQMGQAKGWLPDVDSILPQKGQQLAGPIQAPLAATKKKNALANMFSDRGIPANPDPKLFNLNTTQSAVSGFLRDPEPANSAVVPILNGLGNMGQFLTKAPSGFLTGAHNLYADVANGVMGNNNIPQIQNPHPMDFSEPPIPNDNPLDNMRTKAIANNYNRGYIAPIEPELKQQFRERYQANPELWQQAKAAQVASDIQPEQQGLLDAFKNLAR